MKRLSNKAKDQIAIIIFLFIGLAVALILSFCFWFAFNSIAKVNAETITTDLTEQQQINKFYTEETIKAEIEYFASWEAIESMSEEEYQNTFLRG